MGVQFLVRGDSEGHKEDKAGWLGFIKELKKRGLKGVRLFISDACLDLVESLSEVYPDADWQRCAVHFYRNVFSHVPHTKVREVAAMLKAIHAQESREAAESKAKDVVEKLKDKHPVHQFRVGGKQEAQRKRDLQNPLEEGPGWQHFINQQGGALHHAAGTAAWAETSSLKGKGQAFQ